MSLCPYLKTSVMMRKDGRTKSGKMEVEAAAEEGQE